MSTQQQENQDYYDILNNKIRLESFESNGLAEETMIQHLK